MNFQQGINQECLNVINVICSSSIQDYERFVSRSQDMELQLTSKEKELEQLFQKQRRVSWRSQSDTTKNPEQKKHQLALTAELNLSSP